MATKVKKAKKAAKSTMAVNPAPTTDKGAQGAFNKGVDMAQKVAMREQYKAVGGQHTPASRLDATRPASPSRATSKTKPVSRNAKTSR